MRASDGGVDREVPVVEPRPSHARHGIGAEDGSGTGTSAGPGADPHTEPHAEPRTASNTAPSTQPSTQPSPGPGTGPGVFSGTAPGSTPATPPDTTPRGVPGLDTPPRPRASRRAARLAAAVAGALLFGIVTAGANGLADLPVLDALPGHGRADAARSLVDDATRGGTHGAPAEPGGDRRPTGPAPAPTATPTRAPDLGRAEVTALITRQSEALRARDQAMFLEPYAADRPALVADRTRLFTNLLKIPFARAEYRLQSTTPVPAESTGTRRTSTVSVVFSHQITGVDVAPIAEVYRWTVSRAEPGAPLRITAVDGGTGEGTRGGSTYPAPWDIADLVVVEKPHVLLLAARQHQAKAATWASRAETAAQRNLAAWKSAEPTPQRFVVFLTPDRASFERVRGGDTVTTNAIGVCQSLPADPAGRTPTTPDYAGSRIYVDSTSEDITDGAADNAIALFRHEMGHAMTAPFQKRVAGTTPPLWVAEGFAGYLEWHDRSLDRWYVPAAREAVRTGKFDGKLPTDPQIYSADPKVSSVGYHVAMLAIRYIADKHGAAKAYEFVIAVYRDPRPASVDTALTAATGLTRAEFEAKWAQYVKSKAG